MSKSPLKQMQIVQSKTVELINISRQIRELSKKKRSLAQEIPRLITKMELR